MYTSKASPDMAASNSEEMALMILEVLSTSCGLLSSIQSPFQGDFTAQKVFKKSTEGKHISLDG